MYETIYFAAGSTIRLRCPSKSPRMRWQKISNLGSPVVYISNTNRNRDLPQSVRNRLYIKENYDMEIRKASKDDEGIYECTSIVDQPCVISRLLVKLFRKPRNIMIEEDTSAGHLLRGFEGIDMKIYCSVISGVPDNETISLTKNSKILAEGGPRYLVYSFTPSRTDHLENITCSANNIFTEEPISFHATLHLTLKPVVSIDAVPEGTIIEGQRLEIVCNDENSGTSLLYAWNHNSLNLNATSRILKFDYVSKSDEGNYSCSVSNKAGTSTGYTNITIRSKSGMVQTKEIYFLSAGSTCLGILIISIIAPFLWYIRQARKGQSIDSEEFYTNNEGRIVNNVVYMTTNGIPIPSDLRQPAEEQHDSEFANRLNDRVILGNPNYVEIQFRTQENNTRIRGIENRTDYADINVLAAAVEQLSSSSRESSDDDFMYIGTAIEVDNTL